MRPAAMTRIVLAAALAAGLAVCGFVAADVFAGNAGAFTYTGTVVHVVDGDTLDVQVQGQGKVRVRVIGINSPERGACYFRQATNRAVALASGKSVVLHGDRTQATHDRYGRLLAYVDVRGGADLGLQLIRGGYAKAYVYGGRPFLRVGPYRSAEADARAAGAGMWSCNSGAFVPPPIPAPALTTTSAEATTTTATTTPPTATAASTATAPAPTAPTTSAATTTVAPTTTVATTTTAATTTVPPPTTTTAPSSGCDPSYPDFCIPPPPPDLDCKDIAQKNFRVL
ncbi:MAG TPA: thermonuclease family protein, partial [Gaiellaceae bacterium]|nr:thermonuclease family protein [Gaiellaceae bacterium]